MISRYFFLSSLFRQMSTLFRQNEKPLICLESLSKTSLTAQLLISHCFLCVSLCFCLSVPFESPCKVKFDQNSNKRDFGIPGFFPNCPRI